MTSAPLHGWVASIDLWGTLITYGDRTAEAAWRIREFTAALAHFGHPIRSETVRATTLACRESILAEQREQGTQPSAETQVKRILSRLGLDPAGHDELVKVLVVAHTHAVLRACPEVFPEAHRALAGVRATGARLVLTSNTLATPADVTRQMLDDLDLSPAFDDLVFSSDLGIAKPRPDVFQAVAVRSSATLDRVVHFGNDWRTDVLAALAAGCRALWFNPHTRPPRPGIRHIHQLADLPDALRSICAPTEDRSL
ncbi:HAD family hydrolase [Yinghuangia sp. ASG 101]|uniref:HAD family hydrolase n=1 Tax=Yinghuangia sp. ASG 101 TaxID=2896848 RepID=UPI001E2A01EB|nr:HAD family hydrolase [Yinghuangia sp. ASG 101]UGQ10498.1 HAD family hydrolase [Yinghuangia sp. ASG 101]